MFSSPGFWLGFGVGIAMLFAGIVSALLAWWTLRLFRRLCSRLVVPWALRRTSVELARDGSTGILQAGRSTGREHAYAYRPKQARATARI